MHRVSDSDAISWLQASAAGGDGGTGFDAMAWERSAWILHAMYEDPALPDEITHDDFRLASDTTTIVVGALGRSDGPGSGWERLRWRDLADRIGIELFADRLLPWYSAFPFTSWPARLVPPTEGSLDREQFARLVAHLAAISPAAGRTPCRAFYASLSVMDLPGPDDQDVVFTGEIGELLDLYDAEELPGSPSNIWPEDRSWLVYTDWDLCGTKVSGSAGLIERLIADPELEVIATPG